MRGGVSWDMSSTVIQSGLPRPLGGYQPIVEPHSPAPAWHMHHQILPKQEPVEERNDSGINSCSDSHSSPGSDHSQDYNAPTYPFGHLQNHYSPSTAPRIHPNPAAIYQQPGFNRLVQENSSTQEDSNPPIKNEPVPQNAEAEDHLHRLQMSLEKNGLLSQPLSPKLSEHSMDDDNKSDLEIDEYDEQGLRIPKVNSHGKVKTFKCKQCDFIAITKLDFWEHSKGHIKADKLLTCPKCPFVTEYKHHLEYHLRNHFGSKPFKCNKCSYSCVNKSMLNSHMKSHSNIYQYRCADCSYATKYCHSLKLHLRKYSHKPAMVLNPDGTPNPLPIIDVYGTRRGPKQKIHHDAKQDGTPHQAIQNSLAQFMLNAATPQLPFPYPFLGGFPGALGSSLLFQQNLVQLAAQRSASPEPIEEEEEEGIAAPPTKNEEAAEALDLSKPDTTSHDQQPAATKNRRKGKAFKIDRLAIDRQESSSNDEEEEDEEEEEKQQQVEADKTNPSSGDDEGANNVKGEDETTKNNNNNPTGNYSCHFCCISFGDVVLYTMHMGYHGYKDPFTCNMCGEECHDKVSFFLHIARTSHS